MRDKAFLWATWRIIFRVKPPNYARLFSALLGCRTATATVQELLELGLLVNVGVCPGVFLSASFSAAFCAVLERGSVWVRSPGTPDAEGCLLGNWQRSSCKGCKEGLLVQKGKVGKISLEQH